MTKSELCPSTFPKPWVRFSKSLGGIFQKPGWNFPQPWVGFSKSLGGIFHNPGWSYLPLLRPGISLVCLHLLINKAIVLPGAYCVHLVYFSYLTHTFKLLFFKLSFLIPRNFITFNSEIITINLTSFRL